MNPPHIIHVQSESIDHVATGLAAATYRKARGLTGKQIALRMGMSLSQLSRLEAGQRSWSTQYLNEYVKACNEIELENKAACPQVGLAVPAGPVAGTGDNH